MSGVKDPTKAAKILSDGILSMLGDHPFDVLAETDYLAHAIDSTGVTPLAEAAVEWWAGRRPPLWTVERHLGDPRINCVGARESELAMRVAEYVAAQRGIKVKR